MSRHDTYTDERGKQFQFVDELPELANAAPAEFFVYLSPVAVREAESRTGRKVTPATDAENTTSDGKTLRMIGHQRIKAQRVSNLWTI